MCLLIDDLSEYLETVWRTARIEHRCDECRRTIDPGETYQRHVQIFEGDFSAHKMCAHCRATVAVGSALTGCPEQWIWGMVHSLDEEEGFVGNILYDEGHDLSERERALMLATVEGRRCQWRYWDGALWPVPAVPAEVPS